MKRWQTTEAGRLLHAVYGPDRWAHRAARSLGVHVGHVYRIAYGEPLSRRALRRMTHAIDSRVSDRREEVAILHKALDRRYAAHELLIPEARMVLMRLLAARGMKP